MSTTVDKILDSAHQLLINHGYAGISYADIAAQVAISKPTIHHHFPTKADLGVAVVQRYRAHVQAMLDSACSLTARQQLDGYIGYWRDCIRQQAAPFCVCAMLAAELPGLPEAVQAEVRLHFAELRAWLTQVLITGQSDATLTVSQAAEVRAAQIMAAVHGGMLAARALGNPDGYDMVVDGMITAL